MCRFKLAVCRVALQHLWVRPDLLPACVQVGEEKFPSAVPFLPPLTDATMSRYFRFYTAAVSFIVVFGGLLSPILEVKLGLGGEPS